MNEAQKWHFGRRNVDLKLVYIIYIIIYSYIVMVRVFSSLLFSTPLFSTSLLLLLPPTHPAHYSLPLVGTICPLSLLSSYPLILLPLTSYLIRLHPQGNDDDDEWTIVGGAAGGRRRNRRQRGLHPDRAQSRAPRVQGQDYIYIS